MKWAHKLDAPAVNDVDQASVEVVVAESLVTVRASHPTKHLAVDLPLRFHVDVNASSWSLKTLGEQGAPQAWSRGAREVRCSPATHVTSHTPQAHVPGLIVCLGLRAPGSFPFPFALSTAPRHTPRPRR